MMSGLATSDMTFTWAFERHEKDWWHYAFDDDFVK
ncbi:hypothetical protein O164_08175 [Pseudomonas taiwanensis SJ9]|uniref:Uncharacterized protein n=1 Tax=Pseudomonas taiwanensis SJ9 TaxID=1388762 RepID=V7DEC5_9PSED|nr:hypothetical protein O164_08175 [Pseudomonas taiwanensis SJ9]